MLSAICKTLRPAFSKKNGLCTANYKPKGFHSTSLLRINRDHLDSSPSAMHFLGPILNNPDTKKRFQDCSEIISSIVKYSNQKEKEVVQLAHVHRASILRTLGRVEMALQEVYKVEKLGVDSPLVNAETAKELALLGQYGMAARYFTRMISLCRLGSEEYLFALDGRAYVYFLLYKSLRTSSSDRDDPKLYLKKAQQDIDEELEYAPNKYHARLQKARIYSEIDNEVALQEINLVLANSEDSPYLKECALLLLMENKVKNDSIVEIYIPLEKLSSMEEKPTKLSKVIEIVEKLEKAVSYLSEWKTTKQEGGNTEQFEQKFLKEVANPDYKKVKQDILHQFDEMAKIQ